MKKAVLLKLKYLNLLLPLVATSFLVRPAAADQVRLMVNGSTGIAQIQHDLRSAKKSIEIMTYIWDPCSVVSKVLMREIAYKVSQGVSVRMIIDAHTHDAETRRKFTSYTKSLGIELRYFNPRMFFNPASNFRMHAKLIVVDGEKYFSGGRNIADDYFDMANGNWVDRDVQVKGPSAAKAQANFELFWNSNAVDTSKDARADEFAEYQKNCTVWRPADEKLFKELNKNGLNYLKQEKTFTCETVRPIIDDPNFMGRAGEENADGRKSGEYLSGARYTAKRMTKTMVDMIADPQAKHIWIENYTYIPVDKLNRALEAKREQQVPIEVYTSDVMDTGMIDEVANHYHERDSEGSQKIYGISSRGTFSQYWAMTPKDNPFWMIHSKVLVTGDANQEPMHALVGSFNMDPRSYHTNIESGVLVKSCPAFAKHVQESVLRLKAAYDNDRDCEACHKPRPPGKMTDKISAWMLMNLL